MTNYYPTAEGEDSTDTRFYRISEELLKSLRGVMRIQADDESIFGGTIQAKDIRAIQDVLNAGPIKEIDMSDEAINKAHATAYPNYEPNGYPDEMIEKGFRRGWKSCWNYLKDKK